MNWPFIEEVIYSECDHPQDLLGPHTRGTQTLVQAYFPGASAISVLWKGPEGKQETRMEMADEDGFFAQLLPVKDPGEYAYSVTYEIRKEDSKTFLKKTVKSGDPYRHSQILTKGDDGTVRSSFNGLPDAAADVEDQGGINRSLLQYQPDITWHLSKILQLEDADLEADPDLIHNYDIWLFTVHDEIVESSITTSDDEDYYRQLMYYQYLNNIYGGYGGYGYGGYGYGYGGYGYGYDSYGYSNYYNMYLLNAMFSSSSNTTTTTQKSKISPHIF